MRHSLRLIAITAFLLPISLLQPTYGEPLAQVTSGNGNISDSNTPSVIPPQNPSVFHRLNGASPDQVKIALSSGRTDNTSITYTVGQPIINSPKVYLIWYGSWVSPSASASAPATNDYANFTTQLISNLNSSERWNNIMKSYYSRSSASTTNKSYVGNLSQLTLPMISRNTTTYVEPLSDTAIRNIVKSTNPIDPNGIYVVLTSSNVLVDGFNSGKIQFCGYHNFFSSSSGYIKYAFVGDPINASYCQGQPVTPNGNKGADSMASVLIHEIEEAVTDPLLTAWWSSKSTGNENADKCAWTWGTVTSGTNSSGTYYYNYSWNGTKYLIQQEFKLGKISPSTTLDTVSGSCALK